MQMQKCSNFEASADDSVVGKIASANTPRSYDSRRIRPIFTLVSRLRKAVQSFGRLRGEMLSGLKIIQLFLNALSG